MAAGDCLEAAGWVLLQAWQSGSHFPAFAENFAEVLLEAAERGGADDFQQWLAAVTTPKAKERCGLHGLKLPDSALIRESERALHEGSFDGFLRARSKHAEIEQGVNRSADYRAEWRALRRMFPRQTRTARILHRTLAPERNWVRGPGAAFDSADARFQAAVDLLCWKYCLWGIHRGKPLVLKPSVTVTPWGTQIFIPAWQSLDAKRDFDFGYIARLHRARGVPRQGEKLSAGRQWKKSQGLAAYRADIEARASGLRGEARLTLVRERIRASSGMDDRELRRLVAIGREAAGNGGEYKSDLVNELQAVGQKR